MKRTLAFILLVFLVLSPRQVHGLDELNDRYTDAGGVGYSRGTISEPIRGRSGGHTMRGVFLAHGHGIKRGYHIEGAGLVDIAPTILNMLDVPIPRAMDGHVLAEIYQDGFGRAVQYQDVAAPEEQPLHVLSQQDEEAVRQRLRDLGYIS